MVDHSEAFDFQMLFLKSVKQRSVILVLDPYRFCVVFIKMLTRKILLGFCDLIFLTECQRKEERQGWQNIAACRQKWRPWRLFGDSIRWLWWFHLAVIHSLDRHHHHPTASWQLVIIVIITIIFIINVIAVAWAERRYLELIITKAIAEGLIYEIYFGPYWIYY